MDGHLTRDDGVLLGTPDITYNRQIQHYRESSAAHPQHSHSGVEYSAHAYHLSPRGVTRGEPNV